MLSRPSGLNERDGGGRGLDASQHPEDFHLATPPKDDRKWDSGHHDNVRKLDSGLHDNDRKWDSGLHDINRKWDSGHHDNDRKKAAEVCHSERLRGGFSRMSPQTCSFSSHAAPSIPSPLSLGPPSSSLLSAPPPPSLAPPTTLAPPFPLPMTRPLSLAPPHSCTSLEPSVPSPLTTAPLPSSLLSAPPSSSFPPSYLAPPSPYPLFSAPRPSSLLSVNPPSYLAPPVSSLSPSPSSFLSPGSSLAPPFTSPPPPCPCSSLPRLLASHRAEVRRLLRGALASLGRRLAVVERKAELLRRKKKRKRHKGGGTGAAMPSSAPLPSASSSMEEEAYGGGGGGDYGKGRREEEEDDCGRMKRRKEEEEDCGRMKRRKEEEEDCGRFVGRMAVSFEGGGREESRLTMRSLGRKHKRREVGSSPFLPPGQSDSSLSSPLPHKRNGVANHQLLAAVGSLYPEGRAAVLLHSAASSSQHALRLLQVSAGQLDPSTFSSIGWHFAATLAPPLVFSLASSNPDTFRLRRRLSSSTFSSVSPAPLLCLSPVAVETVWGGVCLRPLPPLKDYTAPPSLENDHCYVRLPPPSPPVRRQRRQQDSHSTRSLRPRRPLPLPPCSDNGQSPSSAEYPGRKGERVSQIRIRRATPRSGTELTPLGLPKVKRLRKKEFSLEEIYTNKNYKSPTPNRSLETIFEEPREKDGVLLLIGHQRRRRLLLFPDFTQPRKRRRPQGAGPRKRPTARRHCHGEEEEEEDPDVMLVERLSALEDFLSRQGLDG